MLKEKVKAIWGILTSQSWFVAASKTGKPDSKMFVYGSYTQGMGETMMHCIHSDIMTTREMDQALDLAKNIITKAS